MWLEHLVVINMTPKTLGTLVWALFEVYIMHSGLKPLRHLLSTYFLPPLSFTKYLTKPVSKWQLNVALRAEFQYLFETLLWNTRRTSVTDKNVSTASLFAWYINRTEKNLNSFEVLTLLLFFFSPEQSVGLQTTWPLRSWTDRAMVLSLTSGLLDVSCESFFLFSVNKELLAVSSHL